MNNQQVQNQKQNQVKTKKKPTKVVPRRKGYRGELY